MAFEDNIKRLEKIVNLLNSDEISLNEGLELLEEGVRVVKDCNEQLDKGKGKLQILIEGDNGSAAWSECELEGDI